MAPSVLADDSAGKAGDLYIRSVCFSPDGKYLATGAEDKQIRVRISLLCFISCTYIYICRSGTLPKNAFAMSLTGTNKKSTPLTFPSTADSSSPAQAIKQPESGTCSTAHPKSSPSTTPIRSIMTPE